jgi:nitrile hydratase accessory protein
LSGRETIADLVPAHLKDCGEPVFAEPWQAEAFAMTVTLHQAGRFTWTEWADALGAEIKRAGTADAGGARYYEFWLAALEKIIAAKGLVSAAEIDATTQAWRDAYLHTPHGQPVALPSGALPPVT